MSNESLLILSALVDIVAVFIASRLGSRWLYGAILLNLLLITIFGVKLISVFGLITNVGNVFYACVFLATHFLIEQKDKKHSLQTIWFGAGFVGLFILMSQLVIGFSGVVLNDPSNAAIQTLFSLSPRVALASILAYIFAQYVNISVYDWLTERMQGRFLWLRSNSANILAQLLDSSIFFTIAFIDLPGLVLLQAIMAGFLIKALVVLLGTPFLYLDKFLSRGEKL